jgi:hypothetical protein
MENLVSIPSCVIFGIALASNRYIPNRLAKNDPKQTVEYLFLFAFINTKLICEITFFRFIQKRHGV